MRFSFLSIPFGFCRIALLALLCTGIVSTAVAQKQPSRSYPGRFYTSVEKLAQFPGGQDAMLLFLAENIQFPGSLDRINYKTGPVKVRFIIAPNGTLHDITVDSAPVLMPEAEKGMDEYRINIIRAIEKMPRWIPARMGGEPVAMLYTIPLKVDN
ncbi:energy transducer TonB [uncultured Fibrella sp.]|uniref:energy transducer TonB n=1 Tax=uncultured Fibrella sp. TaxID=1284596 RepID=UPI0035CA164F